jgi:hypothetical protein
MLPGIFRPTKAQFLDEAAKLLARLAMGLLDNNPRGSRFPPTPTRCATYFGNAVGEAAPDPLGDAYSSTVGQGATVEELFAAAAAKLEPELVMPGHEVLGEFYLRVQQEINAVGADGVPATPAEVSTIVARVLVRDVDEAEVDGSGTSLWVQFMQACYPTSPYLLLALQHSPRVQPNASPFAPWQKVQGTY